MLTTLVLLLSLLAFCGGLFGQVENNNISEVSKLEWSTDSTNPERFISVHGHRAAVLGYSQDGLEIWAYPFQILSSFKLKFRSQGTTSEIDAQAVLRRIIYRPDFVTRVYVGADFIVREKIFVPLDEPGAVFNYEVESVHPLDIVVRFVPVMDLMWPGGIGGQEATWNSASSAYVIQEPVRRFSASIGSSDIIAHDETSNLNRQLSREPGLAFTIRAGSDHPDAQLIVAGGIGAPASTIAKNLAATESVLENAAAEHYSAFLKSALQIETPDERVNRALAWSEIALDQAWVCNPDLGCGLVAGYGPSRKARRPQYDWFFAGDGMVDIPALLAAGQYDSAREELEFILKYQDQKTGMIWHELSQSAAWIDWRQYPYMFVHVELTFNFLHTLDLYFTATADRKFLSEHWSAILAAYKYCSSLINVSDGLPRIPTGKEGSREQEPLSEELALSSHWVFAAAAFADLANATGHTAEAADATLANRKARDAMPKRYWDENQRFWISGYSRSGAPVLDHQIGPLTILDEGVFSPAQRDSIIEQLADSDYQTDWGTRGRSSASHSYNADSYANGSVWATSTSAVATAFWRGHRPAIAFPVWSALVPWNCLDSLGHMHETLAGNYYHEETESVPEQTWSSASFFSSAVVGLLGINVNALTSSVNFAPHLPLHWNTVKIRNLRVGSANIDLTVRSSATELRLQMQNAGAPVKLTFDPEIPLGAKLKGARFQNRPIESTSESSREDTHARAQFDLPHGDSTLTIAYGGGITVLPDVVLPKIGQSSRELRVTRIDLQNEVFTIDFDYVPSAISAFELRTPWIIKAVRGATCERTLTDIYACSISAPANASGDLYQRGKVYVTFASAR